MTMSLTPEQANHQFARLAAAWEGPIRCQCLIGCSDHRRGWCTATAEVLFEVHLLGSCNDDEANPGGNRVELMCVECAGRMWVAITQRVHAMVQAAQRVGARVPQCLSCGARVATTSDVIRGRQRAIGGIQ